VVLYTYVIPKNFSTEHQTITEFRIVRRKLFGRRNNLQEGKKVCNFYEFLLTTKLYEIYFLVSNSRKWEQIRKVVTKRVEN